MKFLISSIVIFGSLNAFARQVDLKCGDEDQDKYELSFDSARKTVTVLKNNAVLCSRSQYLSEGELFEYGEGLAIFYCAGKGLSYRNNFDEWILTIDGRKDKYGYTEEYFCE